jgi:hypothetical protein
MKLFLFNFQVLSRLNRISFLPYTEFRNIAGYFSSLDEFVLWSLNLKRLRRDFFFGSGKRVFHFVVKFLLQSQVFIDQDIGLDLLLTKPQSVIKIRNINSTILVSVKTINEVNLVITTQLKTVSL